MDRLLKRLLIVSLWLIVTSFDVHAQDNEPETVTFQGAVVRHPLSEKSIEVSGVIRFYYEGDEYIEEPFRIESGQRTAAYSKTLSWELPGSLNRDDDYDRRFFLVSVMCEINCNEAGIYDAEMFFRNDGVTGISQKYNAAEEFGRDERDDAYIVDLNLVPKYFFIGVNVNLPNGMIANEDIPIKFIAEDFFVAYGSATDWRQDVRIDTQTIKKGQSSAQFNVRFKFEDEEGYSTRLNGYELYFGYQCLSSACDRAGLQNEAWLGEDQAEFFSDSSSAVSFEIASHFDSGVDEFSVNFSQPLELLSRTNSVEFLVRKGTSLVNERVEGNIIVEKLFYRSFCGTSSEATDEADYNRNNRCNYSTLLPQRTTVSTTQYSLDADEMDKIMTIDMETIKTKRNIYRQFVSFNLDPHQTIRFECTLGCENSQNLKSGYVNENGLFLAISMSQAKKFNQTEDFYTDDLILNLTRPPLLIPMLELLMEEEVDAAVN